MLSGQFDETGRPEISERLSLPRLLIERASVQFLIDTGADVTVLSLTDAKRLGVDYASLKDKEDGMGLGGHAELYVEDALIAFSDDVAVFHYQIQIAIMEDSEDNMTLTSILGRDIINQWSMRYCFSESTIEIYNTGDAAIITRGGK